MQRFPWTVLLDSRVSAGPLSREKPSDLALHGLPPDWISDFAQFGGSWPNLLTLAKPSHPHYRFGSWLRI